MSRFKTRPRVFAAVVVVAAVTPMLFVTGPAQASGSWLCRVDRQAPVFRDSDNRWIYTIPGGRDMRVYKFRGPADQFQIYGHGAGHTRNGWADSRNFTRCRTG